MPPHSTSTHADASTRRRLHVYNGGFLIQRRLRRILGLAGYDIRLGRPKQGDAIGVWGHSPTAHRGEAAAAKHGAVLIRIEDAFLRSVVPGRSGSAPLGLTIDASGMHYDPAQPSELETLLATHPLDDTALLARARAGMTRMKEAHLSKYTGFDPDAPCPAPGYVLVIDQTFEDAAVLRSGADRARFLEMLVFAQEEHPGARIVIKTHPETQAGHRTGYFEPRDAQGPVELCTDPVSPWALLDGAIAVYTVSSQMGLEAIFAGHKPRVFGAPFYAGWGLTVDEAPVTRRQRNLTRGQLFAAAMILYPIWYDPCRDTLCDFETALDVLDADTRAWREDHAGWIASGISRWKRGHFQHIFGTQTPVRFSERIQDVDAAQAKGKRHMVWASRDRAPRLAHSVQIEDGFLRSSGLGANLVPPLSQVLDDQGIYYDPTRPSRLESLIHARATLRPDQSQRAERLIAAIRDLALSKYNLSSANALPKAPDGHCVVVPGQVEDDASIRTGTRDISTNLGLLSAARAAHPEATLFYKPHPDVEAGLRRGKIAQDDMTSLNAHQLDAISAPDAIDLADEIWTMTSLLGFEALLRGCPVTCLGTPFYAGWGLTTDLGPVPARRGAHITLTTLVHAALIDYPRYFDPVTGRACPVEVVVERLAKGRAAPRGLWLRSLAKLQGHLASHAHLWRRGR